MSQHVFLCRHGETEWSRNGRHTGVTDLELTQKGIKEAEALGRRLGGRSFAKVLVSPLKRAGQTCTLAGYKGEITSELVEWNYGRYEGLTTPEIHRKVPSWSVFTHGAPDGESPAEVGARVDRLIEQVRAIDGDVALFAHGHILRVIGARWIGMETVGGRHLVLGTGTTCILGYERDQPALLAWNCQ